MAFASKARDVNMQHGGLTIVQRGKATVDGGRKPIWFGDGFAMRAKSLRHGRKVPPLALMA